MSLKQDSEEEFSWEDDFTIVYNGRPGDFLQQAQAGAGISFSIPGQHFSYLANSEDDSLISLFGIKTIHQMGPLNIYSFLTREQVKKTEKTFEGGTESGASVSIKDYNFIR